MPDVKIPVQSAPEMTCEEAEAKETAGGLDEDEMLLVRMRLMQCSVDGYNKKHKDDPDHSPQIAHVTPDPVEPHKVLFGVLTEKQAKEADGICKVALTGYLGTELGGSSETLAAAFGSFTCDAYFDAAVANDPMLIVFPGLIPGQKMTMELLNHGRVAAGALFQYFKDHPEAIATDGLTPQGQANLLAHLGDALGGDGGKLLSEIGKAAGGVAGQVTQTTKDAGQAVLDGVSHAANEVKNFLRL